MFKAEIAELKEERAKFGEQEQENRKRLQLEIMNLSKEKDEYGMKFSQKSSDNQLQVLLYSLLYAINTYNPLFTQQAKIAMLKSEISGLKEERAKFEQQQENQKSLQLEIMNLRKERDEYEMKFNQKLSHNHALQVLFYLRLCA